MDQHIIVSSIILLAKTETPNHYIFGAYDEHNQATSFLSLPEDHKMFVDTLKNKQTIMGRKTLLATPKDFPDAGRICITHHPNEIKLPAIAAESIVEAINIAKRRALKNNDNRVYIIGGASIIKQAIDKKLVEEIKLTLTEDHLDELVHPVYLDFDLSNWQIVKKSALKTSPHSAPKHLKYQYLTLKR